MKHSLQLVAFVILLILGLFACSPLAPASTQRVPPTGEPSQTLEAAPTQETTPTLPPARIEPHHPLTTRAGNADIDPVLDAVASGDIQELRSVIQFTNTNCTHQEGLGGPPKCREGEAEGTPVEVLPSLGSEGSFVHRDEIEIWTGVHASGLYAIYEVSSNAYSDQDYPAGEYAAIFLTAQNQPAIALQITAGRIVRVDYLFDVTSEGLNAVLERDAAQVILAPRN